MNKKMAAIVGILGMSITGLFMSTANAEMSLCSRIPNICEDTSRILCPVVSEEIVEPLTGECGQEDVPLIEEIIPSVEPNIDPSENPIIDNLPIVIPTPIEPTVEPVVPEMVVPSEKVEASIPSEAKIIYVPLAEDPRIVTVDKFITVERDVEIGEIFRDPFGIVAFSMFILVVFCVLIFYVIGKRLEGLYSAYDISKD